MEDLRHPLVQYAVAEINLALFTSGYLLKQEVFDTEVHLQAARKGATETEFHIVVRHYPTTAAALANRTPDQVSSFTGKPIYLAYISEDESKLFVSPDLLTRLTQYSKFSTSPPQAF